MAPGIRGRGLVLVAMVAAALSASCVRYGRFGGFAEPSGTCGGACDHYLDCREGEAPDARRRCVRECNEIFVQDGTPDTESLRDFEELECEAAVAFVDGEGPRGEKADRNAKLGRDGGQSKSP